MHMKAYQGRGMRITMFNRTTKNTATVTNGTTKTQHSHTQQQHETRGGRRTHTVRYMEAKTVIFSATRENGVPHRHNFFRPEKGVPHATRAITPRAMGYPIPTRFSELGEWGSPSPREMLKCLFFAFVHRNAVVVLHL